MDWNTPMEVKVTCPDCGGDGWYHIVDQDVPPSWYENCPTCGGVNDYTDASKSHKGTGTITVTIPMQPAAGMLVEEHGEWRIATEAESQHKAFHEYYTKNSTPLLLSPAAVPAGVTLWDVLKTISTPDDEDRPAKNPEMRYIHFGDGEMLILCNDPGGVMVRYAVTVWNDHTQQIADRLANYRKALKAYIAQKGWQ